MADDSEEMDRNQVLAAMHVASLIAPSVIMRKLRDGSHVFDLFAGHPDRRSTQRVIATAGKPTMATRERVEAAISAIQVWD